MECGDGIIVFALPLRIAGIGIATNPSQENPYTEQNDDSVTQQRTRKVTGVVLDANGESIIGANVVVKGTNNGTITDLDGKFSIELSDGETLQVSFIGYNSKDVMVGAGENHIKVQLREDTQKLDEVVVVGYGTQIKRAVPAPCNPSSRKRWRICP